MRQLLEADVEPALQHCEVITRILASAHEPAVGHQQRGREIARKVAAEHPPGSAVGKSGTVRQRGNLVALLEHGELDCDLEIAR